jgi:hypothetical protein
LDHAEVRAVELQRGKFVILAGRQSDRAARRTAALRNEDFSPAPPLTWTVIVLPLSLAKPIIQPVPIDVVDGKVTVSDDVGVL